MRRRAPNPSVPLFPFLSVLLSTMGVLAFLSISFLIISRFTPDEIVQQRQIEFEWIGAPEYVEPIYIKCLGDYIEYYNLFSNREERIASAINFDVYNLNLDLKNSLMAAKKKGKHRTEMSLRELKT